MKNSSASPTFLIVDDQEAMRFTISRKIKAAFNAHIFEARGVTDAILHLKENKVDLVISDHWMDDGLGYQIAVFIDNSMKSPPPIIFFSSDSDIIYMHLRERKHNAILKPDLNGLIDAIIGLGFEKRDTGKI